VKFNLTKWNLLFQLTSTITAHISIEVSEIITIIVVIKIVTIIELGEIITIIDAKNVPMNS
jgi:hypothetical protein